MSYIYIIYSYFLFFNISFSPFYVRRRPARFFSHLLLYKKSGFCQGILSIFRNPQTFIRFQLKLIERYSLYLDANSCALRFISLNMWIYMSICPIS